MKIQLKLEELAMFGLAFYLFTTLPLEWWWFLVLLLLPDAGMIGYAINPRAGAITYNLFHHKGIAILLYGAGVALHEEWLQAAGLIMFGHASMDRIFGFGLKFPDSFKNTHLGKIGGGD
ncbi:MAG: DUF4260 domain-containing protein [Bacteroidia bacterium]